MSVNAIIQDGKVQETASQSSVQKAASTGNGMDKDAFLQLLVAQMKYQDPLEPTSNTEYISQYATFSQVEQMQNMSSTMELTRASSMVGKLVEVQSTDNNGETSTIEGVVEYVSYENNKAYVAINGTLYSAEDVTAVIDETYYSATELATSFMKEMNKLPALDNLTLTDKENVDLLQETFNNMTAYQQSFVGKDYVEALQAYVEKMSLLVEAAKENTESAETAENTEGVEDIGAVEETEDSSEVKDQTAEEGNVETETDAADKLLEDNAAEAAV